ncbi:mandelate racemase/muconate lactonizing enzyme family protein [Xylophilus sp.]|uniref:mandelate racemase/muconate lactonizing enzyme family protein n=1 Tax=Xylophilus sp. TaxID=2653893 RepID=UPI002D7FC9EB|nr:mandelate racemase/muconate lactonizing enzyme family protein [Xylophilus sp.]
MKVQSVEPILLSIPFEDGGSGTGGTPGRWHTLDTVLVKVTADNGLVGWGEAFGYFCHHAVGEHIRNLVAAQFIGRTLDDVEALNLEVQRKLSLFGRCGLTIFALSGIDIALWDLKAKAAGVDLATLIAGKRRRENVQAYASLVRYGDEALVTRFCTQAVNEGFRSVKLHEVTLPEIRAARSAIGPDVSLTVDVNCSWSESQAMSLIPELRALDVLWVEEPIFPPEDWDTLARLGQLGVDIAAGENACTAQEFGHLARATRYLQPSITKVGGVSEFLRVARLAAQTGRGLMPHSPYFGPGHYATQQMAAALENFGLFEHLYVEPEAWFGGEPLTPHRGEVAIPRGPGIGFEPDPAVLERYAVC